MKPDFLNPLNTIKKYTNFSIQCLAISETALLFIYLFTESSQTLRVLLSGRSNMQMKMSVEHLRNDTDSGKPNYSEKTLPQCHFVLRKSHMDWPEIETGPPR